METPSTRAGRKVQTSRYAKEYIIEDKAVRRLQWNGREIRNTLQTAILLATYKAHIEGKDRDGVIIVKPEHFKQVVDKNRKFKKNLDSITKKDEKARAAALYDRPPDNPDISL